MKLRTIKPQRVKVKPIAGESRSDTKKRQTDAERAEYKRVAAHNAEVAKNRGRNPDQDTPETGSEKYVSHRDLGRGRHSTGHHD